jgi:hypothetical protein
MPVGLEIMTSGGILQISSEKKVYVLKASGVLTTDSGNIAYFTHAIGTYVAPMVFWQEGVAPAWTNVNPALGIPEGHIAYVAYGTAPGQTVRWYLYDVISASSGFNYGLQLFNSAGQITFDAAQRPLVPYSIVNNVKPSTAPTVAIDTGRTYAVHIALAPIRYTFFAVIDKVGPTGRYDIIRPVRSGSNLNLSSFDYVGSNEIPGDFSSYEYPATSAVVVDIHDYIAA